MLFLYDGNIKFIQLDGVPNASCISVLQILSGDVDQASVIVWIVHNNGAHYSYIENAEALLFIQTHPPVKFYHTFSLA